MSNFKVNDLVKVVNHNNYYNGSSIKGSVFKVLDVSGDSVVIEIDGRKYDISENSLELHKEYKTELEIKLEELRISLENKLDDFQNKNTDQRIYEIGNDDPMDAFQLGSDEGFLQGKIHLINEILNMNKQ